MAGLMSVRKVTVIDYTEVRLLWRDLVPRLEIEATPKFLIVYKQLYFVKRCHQRLRLLGTGA